MAETIITDISQTTFNREVNQVISAGEKKVFYKWKVQLFADKHKLTTYYLSGISNTRDYVNQYTDAICMDLVLNDQDYQRLVVPNRNKLRIRVFKEPVAFLSGNSIPGTTISQEFVAMLYDNRSSIMESNNMMNSNSDVGNKANLVTVRFFLLNKTIENLRLRTMGTTVRETITAEAIRGILHQETISAATKVSEVYKGIDLADGYSANIKKQIPIPDGTSLIGEDGFIRQMEDISGGIYNSGFNYYYQQGSWYLYPPFSTNRYNNCKTKTLTIINLPKDRYPSIERTYRQTPTQLIVLSTGATIHQDNSSSAQKNDGNAVMFIDSNAVYNNFARMDGDKLVVDSKKNVNIFGVDSNERTTSNGEVVMKNKGVTNKYFKEYSKLALRLGMVIGCKWENADPDLIYPGMPVKFMYLDGLQPREVIGSVIGSSVVTVGQGQNSGNGSDRKFSTSVLISIFIANKINIKPN